MIIISDKLWKQAERRICRKFGTERNWLSRTRGGCEDCISEDFAIDVKSTKAKEMISIKKSDLKEIEKRGKELMKTGILCFRFFNDNQDYCIINLNSFLRLIYNEKGK